MDDLQLIFIHDQGVLGLGKETSYGCDAYYYIDGILFECSLETDEYEAWGPVENLRTDVLRYFEL